MALHTRGVALCRGRNLEGQCGQSDMPVVAEPTEVEGLAGLGVRNVQGGRAHAAAVLDTGEVLTWGCGHSGKLGHGAAGSSPDPTRYSLPLSPPSPVASKNPAAFVPVAAAGSSPDPAPALLALHPLSPAFAKNLRCICGYRQMQLRSCELVS